MKLPNLDDRRWSDLAEEGRNLIPKYAPEWTDFNIHDPGITLLDLFAWVAEMDVYRLNRIPEAHRRKFLSLLGIVSQPPRASHVVLSMALRTGVPPLEVPSTIEFESQDGVIPYRSFSPVVVIPSEVVALFQEDARGVRNVTSAWENHEPVPMFGDIPTSESAFYFGFSLSFPVGRTASLYLTFAGGRSDRGERQRIQAEIASTNEQCAPPSNPCRKRTSAESAATSIPLQHHSARVVWEFAAPAGSSVSWQVLSPDAGEVEDETRSLSLDGVVRFTVPSAMAAVKLTPSATPVFSVRCRIVSGALDASPVLKGVLINAVDAEQSIPVATQLAIAQGAVISGPTPAPGSVTKFSFIRNPDGQIGSLTFLPQESDGPEVFINSWIPPTSISPGSIGCALQVLGIGLGEPLQRVAVQPSPVIPEGLEVFTLEGGLWHRWTIHSNFGASGRTDRHVLVDFTTGEVTFGDGEHGLPAPEGALIVAGFFSTRAARGNIAAGTAFRVSDSPHNRALIHVSDVCAALVAVQAGVSSSDGGDAEPLDHAEGRTLEEVSRVTRAVTASDLEQLALKTPGTRIARVSVRANVDGRYPCLRAPGVVTVVILPMISAPRAQPSLGLRSIVRHYLNRRRIIGSRIEVIGPTHTQITVRAQVQRTSGADAVRVKTEVSQALLDFFDPLEGGPEGRGWPFGRDVYRSEVLQVIDNVNGVENVIALEILADDGLASCSNVCLGPIGLPVSGPHEITIA